MWGLGTAPLAAFSPETRNPKPGGKPEARNPKVKPPNPNSKTQTPKHKPTTPSPKPRAPNPKLSPPNPNPKPESLEPKIQISNSKAQSTNRNGRLVRNSQPMWSRTRRLRESTPLRSIESTPDLPFLASSRRCCRMEACRGAIRLVRLRSRARSFRFGNRNSKPETRTSEPAS